MEEKNTRILSIDYGDSRVGLAVSDLLGITAQGLETVNHNGNDKKLLARLDEIINIATKYNLNVKELILVQTKNSDISMILVKCIKNSKNGMKIKVLDVSKCSTYQHIFER